MAKASTRNWRNRIVEHGEIDPRLLTPNPQNFRRHPARQNSALSAALSKLGWIDEIIVSARSGLIIDGHDRRDLAIEHGEPSVPYLKVDLTPDEEKIALATFDRITDMADVDGDALAQLLSEIDDEAFTGQFWTDDELAELMSSLDGDEPKADPGAQVDRAEELQQKWQVQRGDLWQIGKHRLLCGDSTNADDVARVMQGEKADAVVTDPPYGINHNTNYKRFTGGLSDSRNFDKPIENDDRPFDPTPFLDYPTVIMWGSNCFSNRLPIGTLLIWDKRVDGQDKLLSDGEVAWLNRGHGVYIFNHGWNGFLRESERGKTLHPTQKPVELFVWCFTWIVENAIVFDPFCGSGPVLAACEQTGRIGRGIEISEKYCAVILERLSGMGITPERVS